MSSSSSSSSSCRCDARLKKGEPPPAQQHRIG
jgi:hypothetical protein